MPASPAGPTAAPPPVYDCNAVNRGVYIADNLEFLRSLNDACIDLVCIDPPFDKNETFVADKLKPPLWGAAPCAMPWAAPVPLSTAATWPPTPTCLK